MISASFVVDENYSDAEASIREHMNRVLSLVLKVFFRLSNNMEGEEAYFSLPFYQNLIYTNWLFDMPKLLDLSAVYSFHNPKTLKVLIDNVFENEKKYI